MIRKITKSGHYKDINIVGDNRNEGVGLTIHCVGMVVIDNLVVSNIFIPLIINGTGSVVIKRMFASEFGGDCINIRQSSVTINSLQVRSPTPTRPYNSLTRKGGESVEQCLDRNGVCVYDTSLLSFHNGVILGYHVDQVCQIYAVYSDGYTIDQDGVIEDVHIHNIDVEMSEGAQGVMCSEGSGIVNCSFGTEGLRMVGSGYPYPLVFNAASGLRVGDKGKVVELDQGTSVRIANNKPTRYVSEDIKVYGVSVTGYEMKKDKKTLIDYARELNIDRDVLTALVKQESGGRAFRYDLPVMLFEGHVFERCLRRQGHNPSELIRHNSKLAEIIRITPYRKYGSYRNQLKRYRLAKSVDVDCAIMACSWGKFQVLGENWEMVGEESPTAFLDTMSTEEGQLKIFVAYVQSKKGLIEALRDKNWHEIKRLYNGKQDYDGDGDGEDDYTASLVRNYTRTVQRNAPRKPLTKSNTMRNNVASVAIKTGAVGGVLYNGSSITEVLSSITTKVAEIKEVKLLATDAIEQVETLTSGMSDIESKLEMMSWLPYAVVLLLILAIYPHVRVAISYMIDNGYLPDRRDVDDYD